MKVAKNWQQGINAGCYFGIHGEPFIFLDIENTNTGKSERIKFIIDTGFNGYLQLNKIIVNKLQLSIRGTKDSVIADGSKIKVELAQLKQVKIGNFTITNIPVQISKDGVCLIGTKLLQQLELLLVIDYKKLVNGQIKNYLTISADKKVKKKVLKTIDKYSH